MRFPWPGAFRGGAAERPLRPCRTPAGADRRRRQARDPRAHRYRRVHRPVRLAQKARATTWSGCARFTARRRRRFTFIPIRGFFKCFGCGAGGDVIRFVQLHDNLRSSTRCACSRSAPGSRLESENPRTARVRSEREAIYHANDRGARYFHRMLRASRRRAGRARTARSADSARDRSSSSSSASRPTRWDGLVDELERERRRSRRWRRRPGLVKTGQRGYYDFYRDRLMIPTYATTGEVDRVRRPRARRRRAEISQHDDDAGLHQGALSVRARSRAPRGAARAARSIVVEGYLDCIALHQAGFKNAVASLGTAFTPSRRASCASTPRTCSSASTATRPGQRRRPKSIDTALRR